MYSMKGNSPPGFFFLTTFTHTPSTINKEVQLIIYYLQISVPHHLRPNKGELCWCFFSVNDWALLQTVCRWAVCGNVLSVFVCMCLSLHLREFPFRLPKALPSRCPGPAKPIGVLSFCASFSVWPCRSAAGSRPHVPPRAEVTCPACWGLFLVVLVTQREIQSFRQSLGKVGSDLRQGDERLCEGALSGLRFPPSPTSPCSTSRTHTQLLPVECRRNREEEPESTFNYCRESVWFQFELYRFHLWFLKLGP